MKPSLAIVLLMAVATPAAAAGPMGGSGGTLKPSSGTFGGARAASPAYGAKPIGGSTAPRRYGVPSPTSSTRSTPSTAPDGEDSFKPYKPSSVYSDRGGGGGYPKPAKPKGYIDPSRRTGF